LRSTLKGLSCMDAGFKGGAHDVHQNSPLQVDFMPRA
jgi:hypothetical protein